MSFYRSCVLRLDSFVFGLCSVVCVCFYVVEYLGCLETDQSGVIGGWGLRSQPCPKTDVPVKAHRQYELRNLEGTTSAE